MKRIMLIAGETSGDLLAAELVTELKNLEPDLELFGAGGPRMAAAGVELKFDMTQHALIGLWEAIRKYFDFRRMMNELLKLAIDRRPNIIVCVDFGGFNSRFGTALRDYQRHYLAHTGWEPKLIQFVSPQVWASRPGRARKLANNFDKLLCILPFEKRWWNGNVRGFPVEFVGHPIVGRHGNSDFKSEISDPPVIALLPGSRRGELKKHLPLVRDAAIRIAAAAPVAFHMLLPDVKAAELAAPYVSSIPKCEVVVGETADVLRKATLALSKTGTITLECALFGVPAITFYKTSPLTYWIGRQVVTVPYLSMPNLLADEAVFPEFVQDDATAGNLADAAMELLNDPKLREQRQAKLREIVSLLGNPGAPKRAAHAILNESSFHKQARSG